MDDTIDLKQHMKTTERDLIINALKKSSGVAMAARKLKIQRTNLVMKLKTMGINPYDYTKCVCNCNCHKSTEAKKNAEVTDSYLE